VDSEGVRTGNWTADKEGMIQFHKIPAKGPDSFTPEQGQAAVIKTLQARDGTHGNYKLQCEVTYKLKDVIDWGNRKDLKPYQLEALDMICLKIGRILIGNDREPDHWHDIAGYATLVEKILEKETT